jgi:high-affinity nickel-transport protein
VGEIGGTVGTAISAAFLFLIALINIIFLAQAIRERKRLQSGNTVIGEEEERPIQGGGMMVRIIGPVLKAVDKPWKLYPVGLLFGLGKLSV